MDKQVKSTTSSILRYPGSKAGLAKVIKESIALNNIKTPIFIEPFCGGASVSIALLEADIVDEIVINDVDPIVASLWKCVFFNKDDAKWLSDVIMKVPLTLKFWQYQKNLNPTNRREAALKCLYLNRTSFSGVLHSSAGPIGGQTQAKWSIGCRFNREKLSSRITGLAQLSSRVRAVTQTSWKKVCEDWRSEKNVFFYFDPPFYHKAKRLYRFVFEDGDHRLFCKYVSALKVPWILSYDNSGEIRELYDKLELNARIIDKTYSARPVGGNSFIGREVMYSNLKELPRPLKTSFHIGLSIRKFKKKRQLGASINYS